MVYLIKLSSYIAEIKCFNKALMAAYTNLYKPLIQLEMTTHIKKIKFHDFKISLAGVLTSIVMLFVSLTTFAHCDSYDGPVIKDATKALEFNDVSLVLKWINEEQETEITTLFNKTYALKKQDKQIYEIVEKHFFETLVRLHRETEGAPYTGLKPAGSTVQIVQMTDKALDEDNIEDLIIKLDNHIHQTIHDKYKEVAKLYKVKDTSTALGRAFVAAYVDYTHTIEAIHHIIDHGANHHH